MNASITKTFILIFFICAIQACNDSPKEETTKSTNEVHNPEWGELQDSQNPPFSFELIDSIVVDTPDDLIVTNINSLIMGPEGHFYFLDGRQSRLISITKEGELRWVTGQKGRGPGDFESAYHIVTDGEKLAVSNLSGARLDIYDFEGNFLWSKNFEKEFSFPFPSPIGYTEAGSLLIKRSIMGSWGSRFFVVDVDKDSMRIQSEFEINESEEKGTDVPQGLNMSASTTFHNDKLFVTSLTDYTIKVYNLEGEVLKTITRDFEEIVRPGMSDNPKGIRGFGGLGSPQMLPNGYFFTMVSWPTNIDDPDDYFEKSMSGQNVPDITSKHSIDFYNPEGTLLYSQEGDGGVPEIGYISNAYIDEEGIMYMTSVHPNPVIYRYRLNTPE